MIVAHHFAIGHIPRTGGDTVATMCGDIALDDKVNGYLDGNTGLHKEWQMAGIASDAKHDSFPAGSTGEQRNLILGIRRLPAFMLAIATFLSRGAPKCPAYRFPHKNELIDRSSTWGHATFKKDLGGCMAAIPDVLMNKMTASGTMKISTWIRQENLRSDMIDVARVMLKTEPSDKLKARLMTKPSKKPYSYDHDWGKVFCESDVDKLYENNPTWARYEAQAYETPRIYEYNEVDYYPKNWKVSDYENPLE